jgi:hypothetical protein
MWKRVLRRCHPDTGGDHSLFIWVNSVFEHVAGDTFEPPSREYEPPRRTTTTDTPRVPFEEDAILEVLTACALAMAEAVAEPYGYLLRQVADCHPAEGGPLHRQQTQGASYKSLAAIGHRVGMTKAERVQWYRIAEAVPLSQRHAGHIFTKLHKAAA